MARGQLLVGGKVRATVVSSLQEGDKESVSSSFLLSDLGLKTNKIHAHKRIKKIAIVMTGYS